MSIEARSNPTPFILDCDTGEDDALAVLVSLQRDLQLAGVVTSYGNTSIEHATRNTSRLLSLGDRGDILVLRGSSQPLPGHLFPDKVTAGDFVGKNGICNTELPESKFDNVEAPEEEVFPQRLLEIMKQHGSLDYVITGPCTNFARVLDADGDNVRKHVKNVYIMGGAIHTDGNTGPKNPNTGKPYAEFNFFCDPKAAQKVLESGIPTHLVSWDLTSTITVPYDEIKQFESDTAVGQFTIALMTNFFEYYGLAHDRKFELNDPVTLYARDGIGTATQKTITVLTDPDQYGRSVEDPSGSPIHYHQMNAEEIGHVVGDILTNLDIQRT